MATKVIRITAGTSFTIPADWNNTNTITLIGGGGGGQRAPNGAVTGGKGGGGGGGRNIITNFTATPGSSITYAIGAQGLGGTTASTAGSATAGGQTSWNAGASTANGGSPGVNSSSGTAGGFGGSGTAGPGGVVTNGGQGGFSNGTNRAGGGGGGCAGIASRIGGAAGAITGSGGGGGGGIDSAGATSPATTNGAGAAGGLGNAGTAGGTAGTAGGGAGGTGNSPAGSGGGGGGGRSAASATAGAGGGGGAYAEFTSYQTWTGSSYTIVTNSSGRSAGGGGGGGNASTTASVGGAGGSASAFGYGGGGGGGGGGVTSGNGGNGSSGVIFISYATGTRNLYWVGGTGTWSTTNATNWSLTSGGAGGEPPPDSGDNVIFDANSGSGTITPNFAVCRDFTTSSPSVSFIGSGSISVYGSSFTTSAGTTWSATGAINFYNTSAVTVTTNGVIFPNSFSVLAAATVLTLGDALQCDVFNINVNGGTLSLNGFDLTCRRFEMIGTPTANRNIAFGTNKIILTSATAATSFVNSSAAANGSFGFTGTPYVEFQTTTGLAATFTVDNAQSNTVLNVYVNGNGNFALGNGCECGSLNFTGFTGSWTSALNARFYGDLTLVPAMTYSAVTATITMSAVFSLTQTLTSAGKTLYAIVKTQAGTLNFADNLTLSSSLTLTQGTMTATNQNITASNFSSSNTNVRFLNMGSGTWTLGGWDTFTSSAFGLNAGTSTIDLNSTSWNFFGGDLTYNNLTISGSVATVTNSTLRGSNTFNTFAFTKTVAFNLGFDAGTTTTVSSWIGSGTPGNIFTIYSRTAGSQFTLNKIGGVVSADYLSIQDSNATPGSTWYAGNNSTNVSNNTGWIFTGPPGGTGSYFLLF
jgi:hypothetical protein